jgi:hypothetical protein
MTYLNLRNTSKKSMTEDNIAIAARISPTENIKQ